MNAELEKARKARDKAFEKYTRSVALETKSSLSARKFRNEFRIYADEVRALEREVLSAPITPMYDRN